MGKIVFLICFISFIILGIFSLYSIFSHQPEELSNEYVYNVKSSERVVKFASERKYEIVVNPSLSVPVVHFFCKKEKYHCSIIRVLSCEQYGEILFTNIKNFLFAFHISEEKCESHFISLASRLNRKIIKIEDFEPSYTLYLVE